MLCWWLFCYEPISHSIAVVKAELAEQAVIAQLTKTLQEKIKSQQHSLPDEKRASNKFADHMTQLVAMAADADVYVLATNFKKNSLSETDVLHDQRAQAVLIIKGLAEQLFLFFHMLDTAASFLLRDCEIHRVNDTTLTSSLVIAFQ
jgi:glycerol-3-phosphate dehydrogenase